MVSIRVEKELPGLVFGLINRDNWFSKRNSICAPKALRDGLLPWPRLFCY